MIWQLRLSSRCAAAPRAVLLVDPAASNPLPLLPAPCASRRSGSQQGAAAAAKAYWHPVYTFQEERLAGLGAASSRSSNGSGSGTGGSAGGSGAGPQAPPLLMTLIVMEFCEGGTLRQAIQRGAFEGGGRMWESQASLNEVSRAARSCWRARVWMPCRHRDTRSAAKHAPPASNCRPRCSGRRWTSAEGWPTSTTHSAWCTATCEPAAAARRALPHRGAPPPARPPACAAWDALRQDPVPSPWPAALPLPAGPPTTFCWCPTPPTPAASEPSCLTLVRWGAVCAALPLQQPAPHAPHPDVRRPAAFSHCTAPLACACAGLSVLQDQPHTASAADLAGTVAFLPPEVFTAAGPASPSAAVSSAQDVYSLGIIGGPAALAGPASGLLVCCGLLFVARHRLSTAPCPRSPPPGAAVYSMVCGGETPYGEQSALQVVASKLQVRAGGAGARGWRMHSQPGCILAWWAAGCSRDAST